MILPSERHIAKRHVPTSVVALAFLVTENVFDKDPSRIAPGAGGDYWSGQSNRRHYDRIGRNFRAGAIQDLAM